MGRRRSPAPLAAACGPAAPPEPLFAPLQHRGIVSAALATRVAEGPLDVGRILRDLAALRPLRRVPRRSVPTLRRGVQVLVDISPAMAPYAVDADALAAAVREVAGVPRTEVLSSMRARRARCTAGAGARRPGRRRPGVHPCW